MYLVSDESGEQSSSQKLGSSILNALVIVGVICVATFVLVACYYFRCLKVMIAYLLFASLNLLGYTGGFVVYTAIKVYQWAVDWPSFVFLMYNFAVGGIVAVFWQKGVPRIVTQGYLVAVSVIMAWIVTKLPEWTSWSLLVALALYDLCAVLTPCGPLKALVKLAQERKDPIPGLLYEANVGNSDDRNPDVVHDTFARPTRRTSAGNDGDRIPNGYATSAATAAPRTPPLDDDAGAAGVGAGAATGASSSARRKKPSADPNPPRGSMEDVDLTASGSGSGAGSGSGSGSGSGGGASSSSRGARRNDARSPSPTSHYVDMSSHDKQQYAAQQEDEHEDDGGDNSIKLGLGDFVFYSVLVSRAALFDSASMAACFVAILMGLGGTLILLAVFQKALPALPISIFLGVLVYLLTRATLIPFVSEVSLAGITI